MTGIQTARTRGLVFILILSIGLLLPQFRTGAAAPQPSVHLSERLLGVPTGYGSALRLSRGGSIGCRKPTAELAATAANRDLTRALKPINTVRTQAESGLTLVLRATDALDQHSEAKAAFQRAARLWESRVRTPVTVIVDVDFGPTWFGAPYEGDVVGLTNPQMLAGPGLYLETLEHMLDRVSTGAEQTLYHSLPLPVVPTDQGDENSILAPSAVFRAVGMIHNVAVPEFEPDSWGPPPAIGLNSSVEYDFDPSDGIDQDKADFESVAAHELGHVLGFESAVGQLELNPDCIPGITIWDLFRVRPGVSMATFAAAQRVLTSGGSQVFFNGTDQWQLSTGLPDDTTGDGQQPSHWRDDVELGHRIGVMDPTIEPGRRQSVTLRDLHALDLMGYALTAVGDNAPSISSLNADLNGDILTLNVLGSDPDGDVVKAKLTLFDDKDRVVGETSAFDVDAGVPSGVVLRVDAPGLGGVPAALQAGLTLIDTRDNQSKMIVGDFSAGDKGGPKIKSAEYRSGKLIIKGKKLGGQAEIEVNSSLILASFGVTATNKKIEVKAPEASLSIHPGPNRIRVINGGLRSNIIVMEN
jgi:hypothetical protein